MADMTYDEVLEQALKLSVADQLRLISAVAQKLAEQFESAQPSVDEAFPSLASNLYEIAQDLEKNPPTGPGWPRTSD